MHLLSISVGMAVTVVFSRMQRFCTAIWILLTPKTTKTSKGRRVLKKSHLITQGRLRTTYNNKKQRIENTGCIRHFGTSQHQITECSNKQIQVEAKKTTIIKVYGQKIPSLLLQILKFRLTLPLVASSHKSCAWIGMFRVDCESAHKPGPLTL